MARFSFVQSGSIDPIEERLLDELLRHLRAFAYPSRRCLYDVVAMLTNPHDALFKSAFGRVDVARIAGPARQEDIVNAADHLIAQGVAKGLEQGREQGLEQGLAQGLRRAVVATLAGRAVSMSTDGRARLDACGDADTLQRWLARAVTASSEADVFAADG